MLSKKVCLLGDFAVGKTSLVRRFVYNRFDDQYLSTIGVKVSRKTVAVPRQSEVLELTMMLWDLAGSQEFNQVRASYLRGVAGAVLVCDLCRAYTLDGLHVYLEELAKSNAHPALIIAANKMDLAAQHELQAAQVEKFAAKLNAPFYLTSARQGEGVEAVFRHLGKLLVE
ncbi:MAG: Rab family GTPase [Caldilineaceae bacterium]